MRAAWVSCQPRPWFGSAFTERSCTEQSGDTSSALVNAGCDTFPGSGLVWRIVPFAINHSDKERMKERSRMKGRPKKMTSHIYTHTLYYFEPSVSRPNSCKGFDSVINSTLIE